MAVDWWAYLDKLRAEPEEKRRALRWWSASLLTLIILGLWLLVWRSTADYQAPMTQAIEQTGVWAEIKLRIVTGWKTLIKTK